MRIRKECFVRRLFIVAVIALFGAYCWAAYRNHTYVELPDYETVTIDLLGGRTPAAWRGGTDAEEQKLAEKFRRDHLGRLAMRRLQPLPGNPVSVGGRPLPPGESLDRDDLQALVDQALQRGDTEIRLRDPAPLQALEDRDFRLRNPIRDPAQDTLLFRGGEPLTKEAIDRLKAIGRERVGIVGAGQPVAPQPATMAMVILIFLALVAALKETLWTPLLALIDSRQQDLDRGKQQAKANQAEAERIETEAREQRIALRESYLRKLGATQREARQEADHIVTEAKQEAGKLRAETERELAEEVEQAASTLRERVPALAREIANRLLGRAAGRPDGSGANAED